MSYAQFLLWLFARASPTPTPSPSPSPNATLDPQVTAAIIAVCGVVLTALVTLGLQLVGRRWTKKELEDQRKYLDKTLDEQHIQALNERFVTAAGQLGRDKPPEVRLAGVYAMAGLADDWKENRQACVDVLCGYLRLPHDPDPGKEAKPAKRAAYLANREVRHTVIRIITAHLQDDIAEARSWRGRDFDFTGVVFDGGDFSGAKFVGGMVNFDGAEFTGDQKVYFVRAEFSGGRVSFGGARFSGNSVSFHLAYFSGGEVSFDSARFSGDSVSFHLVDFSGGEVSFVRAEFSGGRVDFANARFLGGRVSFGAAEFSGSEVNFDRDHFSGGTVYFNGARFLGGRVSFRGAEFSSGEVNFGNAKFSSAEFSSGEVNFRDAQFTSGVVDFPWTGTPPPGVTLPEKEDQSQT